LSCIEVIEQDTERGFVKARVLGFEYEIIVGFGREQVGDILYLSWTRPVP